MKKLVIIGSGGFGRECAEICKAVITNRGEINLLGFIDDNKELHNKVINGVPVLGGLDWIDSRKKKEEIFFICAIGETTVKRDVVNRARNKGYLPYTLIYPSVLITYDVKIGEGTIICPGTIVSANTTIKDYVIINQICSIGHDVFIEDYVTINPLVAVSGGVKIGKGTFVGTHSSIIQYLKVGDWTIIAAGTCVVKDVGDLVIVQGVPAKIKINFRDFDHRKRFSSIKFHKDNYSTKS